MGFNLSTTIEFTYSSTNAESERMDSNHQDLVYDQAVPSYLHFPNNPEAPG
nr:MAG TPA: hypothetical protein [Caudoviricetes sp.]